jgi:hypothetical protein
MRRVLTALFGLAAACTDRPIGEDTDAGSTTSTATTTTAATEAPTTGTTSSEPDTTAEPCLEHSYTSGHPLVWKTTCGLPELCSGDEPLMFTTTNIDAMDPGEVEVEDLERARCMAAALRDRAPGQFAWSQVIGTEVIWSPISLEIVGDTALVRNVQGIHVPELDDTHEAIYPLRPPEFFAACAEGDTLAVWLCLMDSVEPTCLPGPLTCPE